MARSSKSSGGTKSEIAKGAAGVAKRTSGRVRTARELFDVELEDKRSHKPRATPKKGSSKKKVDAKKPSKKSAKRRAAKRSETPDDQDYEVEKIASHRIYNDFYVEYEVKWRNYSKEHNTWLTEYDLRASPQILADYKFSVTNQEDNAGDEYIVEGIVTHRDVGKTRYYLVHWRGFDDPVSHTEMDRYELDHAKDVLFNYESALKKKNEKTAPPPTSTPKNKTSKKPSKKAKKAKKAKKPKTNGMVQDEEEKMDVEQEEPEQERQEDDNCVRIVEIQDEDSSDDED